MPSATSTLERMSPAERTASLQIAGLYALRMLGLFMVLPVLALYARDLPGATPFKLGLALGIYGLTQALLQIPFGSLSDRFGRKPMLLIGLALFGIGSLIAGLGPGIEAIILGRALQGAGAISAVLSALLADLTRPEQRTKAMAIVGVTIGTSFSLSMFLGPVLDRAMGVRGIFLLTAAFTAVALLVVWRLPTPPDSDAAHHPARDWSHLIDPLLWRLNLGVFLLHLILTASFVAIPTLLKDEMGLNPGDHWKVYLPVMLAAFLAMAPLVMRGSRGAGSVLLASIALVGSAQFGLLWAPHHWIVLLLMLWLFFTGFNVLEAAQPALVSQAAPAQAKGAAMGVYATAQFLGAFSGGILGGMLVSRWGAGRLFELHALFCLLWLALSWPLRHLSMQGGRSVIAGHTVET
ncbi:MAG: MFS transporter [Pseudomonadota bacterium]|nr:MFS transporter [Candidatus Acidoferrales bacterium]